MNEEDDNQPINSGRELTHFLCDKYGDVEASKIFVQRLDAAHLVENGQAAFVDLTLITAEPRIRETWMTKAVQWLAIDSEQYVRIEFQSDRDEESERRVISDSGSPLSLTSRLIAALRKITTTVDATRPLSRCIMVHIVSAENASEATVQSIDQQLREVAVSACVIIIFVVDMTLDIDFHPTCDGMASLKERAWQYMVMNDLWRPKLADELIVCRAPFNDLVRDGLRKITRESRQPHNGIKLTIEDVKCIVDSVIESTSPNGSQLTFNEAYRREMTRFYSAVDLFLGLYDGVPPDGMPYPVSVVTTHSRDTLTEPMAQRRRRILRTIPSLFSSLVVCPENTLRFQLTLSDQRILPLRYIKLRFDVPVLGWREFIYILPFPINRVISAIEHEHTAAIAESGYGACRDSYWKKKYIALRARYPNDDDDTDAPRRIEELRECPDCTRMLPLNSFSAGKKTKHGDAVRRKVCHGCHTSAARKRKKLKESFGQ